MTRVVLFKTILYGGGLGPSPSPYKVREMEITRKSSKATQTSLTCWVYNQKYYSGGNYINYYIDKSMLYKIPR